MKIAVVIPWRPQPTRLKAFEFVVEWYKKYLPSAEIILCDSDTEDWNPARARNIGMKKAEEYGAEVVIMNDADTVPSVIPLAKAISGCQEDGLMHNPYTEYRMISYENSMKFFDGIGARELRFLDSFMFTSDVWWGIVVFKPDVWWKLGGMDERLSGWGYEDTAMAYTHAVVFDKTFVKHDGLMISFDHVEQGGEQNRNFDNGDYYKQNYLTRSTPDDILEYVKGNILNPL